MTEMLSNVAFNFNLRRYNKGLREHVSQKVIKHMEAGTSQRCSPRHPPRFESSFFESNDVM